MRRLLTVTGLAVVCTVLATAETWNGLLIDATCYENSKTSKSCGATTSTNTFLLESSGKVYKLDSEGNTKAAEALKSRADREANPGAKVAPVNAKVDGTMEGDTLHVDTIDVQ
jgi:hypothetical protein